MKLDKFKKKELELKAAKLKKRDYLKIHPDFSDTIESVWCKCCGDLIKDLRGDPKRKYQHDGKDYIMAVLAPVGDYQEVTFLFGDGSKHVTPCCGKCAKSLSLEKAEEMYACDMLRWDEEDWVTNWDYFIDRKIKAIVLGD